MRSFVDEHRDVFGVEPIFRQWEIAPSGYRRHVALRRTPEQRSQRVQRDEVLVPELERVWQANLQVYGDDKVWRQLNREGVMAIIDTSRREYNEERPKKSLGRFHTCCICKNTRREIG